MAKINNIFKVDAWLIPAFLGVVVTGIGTHIASERTGHDAWHNWTVAHIAFCFAFLVLMYYHVFQHWGWYKSLIKTGMKHRGVTVTLSALFLIETLSGIILLAFVDGEGSDWGHFHWIVGVLLAVFGIGHLMKRLPRLKKGLKI